MRDTPQHAEKALAIVEHWLPRVAPRDEYLELIAILKNPARWKDAHELFNVIRVNITLRNEHQDMNSLDYHFIGIAENAAKTAYNCSGESARFDDSTFDRLLRCEKDFVERIEKEG